MPAVRAVAIGLHLDTCPACQAVLSTMVWRDPVVDAVRRTASADDGGVGPRLTAFRIVREIGRGGMGVVYEAEQTALGRRVALKVMAGRWEANADAVRRFHREARAVARLHHTNIVPVFAVGCEDGVPFDAMQLIHGVGFDRVIAERLPPAPPDWRAGAELARQAAAALGYAYTQGVVHRDVKPSNLLVDAAGAVWVADFGLAKMPEADELTQTGDIIGTTRYLPPEAFDRPAGPLGDVYALGISLYGWIAGRPAFAAGDRAQVVKLILTSVPPRLRTLRPDVPHDLETIVHKAIDRERRLAGSRRFLIDSGRGCPTLRRNHFPVRNQ